MNIYYGNFTALNIGGTTMSPKEVQAMIDASIDNKLGITGGEVSPTVIPEEFLNTITVDNPESLVPQNPGREQVVYVDESSNSLYIWKNYDDDNPDLGGEYYPASATPGSSATDEDINNIFK